MEWQPIERRRQHDQFRTSPNEAVQALGKELKRQGLDPIDLNVQDLRRSAHYQMRKAGVDAKTRRAIMGHKTASMDDRYTIIDDEALADAVARVNHYQSQKSMRSEAGELASRIQSLPDEEWERLVTLRRRRSSRRTASPVQP